MTPLPRWLRLGGFWIPFAIVTFAAFAPEGLPLPFKVSDVVLHAFAFTYLTTALWVAHYHGKPGWKSAGWMLGYGLLIEAVQSFEPTRSAELGDFGVDIVGILLGLGLYRVLLRVAEPLLTENVSTHQS
jgi:VanZ family protein